MKLDKVISICAVCVALLAAILPAYVSYDLASRGPIIEKQLSTQQIGPNNLLEELESIGKPLELDLKSDHGRLKYLWVVNGILTNSGRSPILPSEIYEPIQISVNKPYNIVALVNYEIGVKFQWSRFDSYTYEARPALINPSDVIWAKIYVTCGNECDSNDASAKNPITISWKARIANLRQFTKAHNIFDTENENSLTWLEVNHSALGVIFILAYCSTFFYLYAFLLYRAGLISVERRRSLALLPILQIVALCAAEATSTYLFPSIKEKILGINHLINIPVIALNIVLVVCGVALPRLSTARASRVLKRVASDG